jgi:membrane-associated progesterone receptor component
MSFNVDATTLAVVVGGAIFVVGAYYYFSSSSSNEETKQDPERPPPEKMERLPVGLMTLDQLSQYRGQDGSRILLSICGRIFDLTKGRDYYGVDGPYHCFTGADASFMLGAMSLTAEDRNKKAFEQDGDHQITLSDWISRFRTKYPIVGRLQGFQDLCPESWREAGSDDQPSQTGAEMEMISVADLREKGVKNYWVSVAGIVFNVRSAPMVYDQYYGDFANAIGNDISNAIAKNEFSNKTYNADIHGQSVVGPLNVEENNRLQRILKAFHETYPVVGRLKSDIPGQYSLPATSTNSNSNSSGTTGDIAPDIGTT